MREAVAAIRRHTHRMALVEERGDFRIGHLNLFAL
jgi:hypothetical protein